jgi:NADPH-dependent glutamate synthase beta subunit-like oxidoreductase
MICKMTVTMIQEPRLASYFYTCATYLHPHQRRAEYIEDEDEAVDKLHRGNDAKSKRDARLAPTGLTLLNRANIQLATEKTKSGRLEGLLTKSTKAKEDLGAQIRRLEQEISETKAMLNPDTNLHVIALSQQVDALTLCVAELEEQKSRHYQDATPSELLELRSEKDQLDLTWSRKFDVLRKEKDSLQTQLDVTRVSVPIHC